MIKLIQVSFRPCHWQKLWLPCPAEAAHTLRYDCAPPSTRLCPHPDYTTYIKTLFVTTAHCPQQGCVLILIIQHTLKHTLRYDYALPSARLCPHPDYTTGTTCVKTHCFLWLDWILPSHVLITGITNMHENALSLMARLNIPPAHPDNTTGTTNMY